MTKNNTQILVAIITTLGSIITTIIVTYKIVKPSPDINHKEPENHYMVHVIDKKTEDPISKAKVSLRCKDYPQEEYTDSDGSCKFKVSFGEERSLDCEVCIKADGYIKSTHNIQILHYGKYFKRICLKPYPPIIVYGKVVNELFSNMLIDSITVNVEVEDDTFVADYNKNDYKKELEPTYIQKKIIVKVTDENYIQVNPIEFKPEEFGSYRKDIKLKHKENLAEEKFGEAKKYRKERKFVKAIESVNQAIEIAHKPNAYILKVQLIGQMLREDDSRVESDLLKFGENVQFDENFQNMPIYFRHNFYLQLGKAFAESRNLNRGINSHYDIAIMAFNKAIELKSEDSRAYQEKYTIQSENEYYSDMVSTINQFFEKNQNYTIEKVVKTFLTELATGIEKLTGYPPNETESKYLEKLKKKPIYLKAWTHLFTLLCNYEGFYSEGKTPSDKRLKKAKSQAMQFSEQRGCS